MITQRTRTARLTCGAFLATLTLALLTGPRPALAQTAGTPINDTVDEVVVTGFRASLAAL